MVHDAEPRAEDGKWLDGVLKRLHEERAALERQLLGARVLQQRYGSVLSTITAVEKLAQAYAEGDHLIQETLRAAEQAQTRMAEAGTKEPEADEFDRHVGQAQFIQHADEAVRGKLADTARERPASEQISEPEPEILRHHQLGEHALHDRKIGERLLRTHRAGQRLVETQKAAERLLDSHKSARRLLETTMSAEKLTTPDKSLQRMLESQRAGEQLLQHRRNAERTAELLNSTNAYIEAFRGPAEMMKNITSGIQAYLQMRMVQQPRTLVEAAEQVLSEAGTPLHIKELVQRVRAKGLHADKDPERVRTSLVPSLNRKAAKGDTFWKDPKSSTYGLLEWNEPEPAEAEDPKLL